MKALSAVLAGLVVVVLGVWQCLDSLNAVQLVAAGLFTAVGVMTVVLGVALYMEDR